MSDGVPPQTPLPILQRSQASTWFQGVLHVRRVMEGGEERLGLGEVEETGKGGMGTGGYKGGNGRGIAPWLLGSKCC